MTGTPRALISYPSKSLRHIGEFRGEFQDWPWSSARAHLTGEDDGLTQTAALGIGPGEWRDFLAAGLDDAMLETIRAGERTGRPLGDAEFVRGLETTTGRQLSRQKPGPKAKAWDQASESGNLV
jgi:hypothetical protein